MRRFFVPAESLGTEEISLPAEVLHHLAVLRLRVGEEILLLDGRGAVCRSRIESLDRRTGRAMVLERWRESETTFPVHLLQAVPKGDKMDLVLQKGTELGIAAFSPLFAGRSVPTPTGDREEKRLCRWERIVREASQQCRRPVLPKISSARPLAAVLPGISEDLRLMLWEGGGRPLADVLPREKPKDAAVLVGPEGGFDPAEAAAAEGAGFVPVHIGPRILRSETAGFAVAAILQYLYGDFGTAIS